MPFVSVTRLRVRSVRFLPSFALATCRSVAQVRRSQGFRGGSLLADQGLTFWTVTAWDSRAAMRGAVTAGPHGAAMPRLLDWCDEAAVVNWEQAEGALPSWPEADRRLREGGRASALRVPSPRHASLSYPTPRVAVVFPFRPARGRPQSRFSSRWR